MKMRPSVILLLVGAAALLVIMLGVRRMHAAGQHLTAAQAMLNQTARDVQRVADLRGKHERIAERKRPEQDVIARVNTVLAEVGIPSNRFGGLRPASDTTLGSPSAANAVQYRQQSVQVTLTELSVGQLGDFLQKWTATQPLWVPTRIELTHARQSDGSDKAYAAQIQLSATYVSHEEPS
jgi:hypothetical protein